MYREEFIRRNFGRFKKWQDGRKKLEKACTFLGGFKIIALCPPTYYLAKKLVKDGCYE